MDSEHNLEQLRYELHEALTRFNQIASHIEDVFFIIEASTRRPLYVSPAFSEIFGRPTADALDPSLEPCTWVLPVDRELVARAVTAFIRGDPLDVECRINRPGGEVRTVRTRAFPVAHEDRVVGIISDVTQERALEEEVRQAQKMEALGALASGIAHDFNNMLMGILGFAAIAMDRIHDSHPAHAVVKRIVDVADRGKTLTRQLVDFSRKRRIERSPILFDAAVADSAPLLATLVGEQVDVVIRTEALGCRVLADPGEVEQLLMNFATNARDSMTTGGRLEVTTREVSVGSAAEGGLAKGRYIELSIRDTGCGMEASTVERLFQPFFTTKKGGHGTGLGLFNARAIINRMGGQVSVSSKVGAGTMFRIFLPLVPETIDLEFTIESERGATVLLVEDDASVRMTVAHYLEKLGFRAIAAANALEARRAATDYGDEIDVLLTDIVMPMQFGSELARDIRAELPGVRVIYMSAHTRDELVADQRIDSESILLQKPFSERRLAFTLHKLLAANRDVA